MCTTRGGRLRLVGYPRVSTRGQVKTGASIPFQDREIRPWAQHNGHRIVGMFPEEGRSGALDLDDRAAVAGLVPGDLDPGADLDAPLLERPLDDLRRAGATRRAIRSHW